MRLQCGQMTSLCSSSAPASMPVHSLHIAMGGTLGAAAWTRGPAPRVDLHRKPTVTQLVVALEAPGGGVGVVRRLTRTHHMHSCLLAAAGRCFAVATPLFVGAGGLRTLEVVNTSNAHNT